MCMIHTFRMMVLSIEPGSVALILFIVCCIILLFAVLTTIPNIILTSLPSSEVEMILSNVMATRLFQEVEHFKLQCWEMCFYTFMYLFIFYLRYIITYLLITFCIISLNVFKSIK